jgi:hypothetical protein
MKMIFVMVAILATATTIFSVFQPHVTVVYTSFVSLLITMFLSAIMGKPRIEKADPVLHTILYSIFSIALIAAICKNVLFIFSVRGLDFGSPAKNIGVSLTSIAALSLAYGIGEISRRFCPKQWLDTF